MGRTTETSYEYDVAVVGGGPAGSSATVFCTREGLSTVVFDRGRSPLKRCAHLENYPGFPAGIDVETLYDLFHDQAERAGCEIADGLVESLDRRDDGAGFVVALQDRQPVTARRVVAATRYDGSYMRGLGDDDEMFETTEHDGVDWVRREAELDEEWTDREAWVEWFDDYYGESAPVDVDSERFERVRAEAIEERLSSYIGPDERESWAETGQAALTAHLDTVAAVEGCGERALLDAMDDDDIAAYLGGDADSQEVSVRGE